jgi:hypothetical protein
MNNSFEFLVLSFELTGALRARLLSISMSAANTETQNSKLKTQNYLPVRIRSTAS